MKRTKTTIVLALVVALLLVSSAAVYGAVAHNRAIARANNQAAAANNAVATTQQAAGSQTPTAPPGGAASPAVTTPASTAPSTAATTQQPSSGSKPSTTPPPATKPPATTSRGGDVHSPLTGRTIFVDAGHGIPGSGANGPHGGDEAANNLATALILRDMLQSAGARVIMTRTTMINPTIPGRTDDQLEARTIMANESGASIFVSLHENLSDDNPAARGLTVYYHSGSAASVKLAQKIDSSTVASTGWYNWGTAVGPYYVLNHSTLKAAVLVECGFLSNATDEQLLGTYAFRQKIAQGVFNGIVAYFQ